VGVVAEHDLDRSEGHQLLRVRHVAPGEDVAISEKRGRPDERLPEWITPLEVVTEGQLEDILSLCRYCWWPVAGVREVALPCCEHGDRLEEVRVLDSGQDWIGAPLELCLFPVVV